MAVLPSADSWPRIQDTAVHSLKQGLHLTATYICISIMDTDVSQIDGDSCEFWSVVVTTRLGGTLGAWGLWDDNGIINNNHTQFGSQEVVC